MPLGRSPINVAPILGVLMVLFVGFSWALHAVPVTMPCGDCSSHGPYHGLDEDDPRRPRYIILTLHADRSFHVRVDQEEPRHVEANRIAPTLLALLANDWAPEVRERFCWGPNVVQLRADPEIPWGDFVDTVSSVSHITGGQVAVVSDEE